ncbi:Ku protein [Spiractinospora alimapuensis]|uniref:non-homologous end joining protein Ku n=1 Tax=Spiractinospora alimapuensis TaxID=2820884 RepID=UPI001EEA57AF|nr:Ku protein [Spiractinospora alimapuensis]QVQ51575.1 Ku protein [Spiractinospora alimapuensis]
MANPVWTGTLTFGMVALSVKLYSARERHGPTMHQFERGTSDRIRYRRVNERTGKAVASEDIVRGASVGPDEEYVILQPEELDDIKPGRSKTMEINGFVPSGSVDPLWYSSTYYMEPDKATAKPYRLLYDALESTGRLGLATFIMRDREHLVLVGPQQGVLSASTLWWPDEVRAPDDVMAPPSRQEAPASAELNLAEQLIEAMATDWQPAEYHDTYEARLEELIAAKAKGQTVSYEPERPARKGKVVELTEALRESLRERKDTGRKRSTSSSRAPEPRASKESGGSPPTKKELLSTAADLGISGRTKMTREELADAVAQARRAS